MHSDAQRETILFLLKIATNQFLFFIFSPHNVTLAGKNAHGGKRKTGTPMESNMSSNKMKIQIELRFYFKTPTARVQFSNLNRTSETQEEKNNHQQRFIYTKVFKIYS